MARLIDGDALIAWIKGGQQMTSKMKSIICYIKTMPTIDAVEVVRCKNCKYCHYEQEDDIFHCDVTSHRFYFDNHYCNYGERKDHE